MLQWLNTTAVGLAVALANQIRSLTSGLPHGQQVLVLRSGGSFPSEPTSTFREGWNAPTSSSRRRKPQPLKPSKQLRTLRKLQVIDVGDLVGIGVSGFSSHPPCWVLSQVRAAILLGFHGPCCVGGNCSTKQIEVFYC